MKSSLVIVTALCFFYKTTCVSTGMREEVGEKLLHSCPTEITYEAKNNIFYTAVREKDWKDVASILQCYSTDIDTHNQKILFMFAAEWEHEKLIALSLKYLPYEFLDYVTQRGIVLPAVKQFLHTRSARESGQFLEIAARKGNKKLVEFLLTEIGRNIPGPAKDQAFVIATHHKHSGVALLLLYYSERDISLRNWLYFLRTVVEMGLNLKNYPDTQELQKNTAVNKTGPS